MQTGSGAVPGGDVRREAHVHDSGERAAVVEGDEPAILRPAAQPRRHRGAARLARDRQRRRGVPARGVSAQRRGRRRPAARFVLVLPFERRRTAPGSTKRRTGRVRGRASRKGFEEEPDGAVESGAVEGGDEPLRPRGAAAERSQEVRGSHARVPLHEHGGQDAGVERSVHRRAHLVQRRDQDRRRAGVGGLPGPGPRARSASQRVQGEPGPSEQHETGAEAGVQEVRYDGTNHTTGGTRLFSRTAERRGSRRLPRGGVTPTRRFAPPGSDEKYDDKVFAS
mmetsp:Transcript_10693/g.41783  ORF Transcript_10693/g.41783 Transcript_10693/m.41783 type:complete len:281 (-) Transcript_10693:1230-2072(-)